MKSTEEKIKWNEINYSPRNIYANLDYKIEPIKVILDCMGWSTEKNNSLESFF